MPDTPQTRNAILDASRAARDKLTVYDHALQDEISDLDDIAFKRELTTNERSKRDKLRAAQANCHHAMVELSFATAAALDNTPEVQRMRNEMATIRSSIAADQKKIAAITKAADRAAEAVKIIAEVAIKLGTFLA